MTHETIKKAIKESADLQLLRSGKTMMPPPNYDIAMCLYERNPDGTESDKPFLSLSRPQDFAVNDYMKYQRFGAIKEYDRDGKKFMACFLVHLYWDGSRDDDSAREIVLNSGAFAYGRWEPTSPSDPLLIDDFWDTEELGDPPNGYIEDMDHALFDNFARELYQKIQFYK